MTTPERHDGRPASQDDDTIGQPPPRESTDTNSENGTIIDDPSRLPQREPLSHDGADTSATALDSEHTLVEDHSADRISSVGFDEITVQQGSDEVRREFVRSSESRTSEPADQTSASVSDASEAADATEATMLESAVSGFTGATDPDATRIPDRPRVGADNLARSSASTPSESERQPAKAGGESARSASEQATTAKSHGTASRWQEEQRYQLVTNFARGGLGQIWLANDQRLRREIAYKELLPAALKNRMAVERFLEEAQITGQLEHPGIVPVYDIGYQSNGTPFYAMKLVRGETMEKEIEALHQLEPTSPERTLRFRRLLGNFIDICNALAFAHDRGVLHRDLKPLNVMLGAFGETLVLDWGLARLFEVAEEHPDLAPVSTHTTSTEATTSDETINESQTGVSATSPGQGPTRVIHTTDATSSNDKTAHTQAGTVGPDRTVTPGASVTANITRRLITTDVRTAGSQTMMGSVMGTPAYMPPEQARGRLDQLDARSDLYSLGGILYKLLTNRQPVPRGKVREVLRNVIDGNVVPPREHDPSIPAAMDAIVMKAMAKERDDRYSSALEIARDVEAWLADEPVSVYTDPWQVRARRWVRRHPKMVAGSGTTLVLAVLVWSGAAFMQRLEVSRLREFAAISLNRAEHAATNRDYATARESVTEALGRVGSRKDLNELRESLNSRLQLIDVQRRQQLSSTVQSGLAQVREMYEAGRYEPARTRLAELQTLLRDEAGLPELAGAVRRESTRVDLAIQQREDVARTEETFREFMDELDQVRVHASFPDDDEVEEDARNAMRHGSTALAFYDAYEGSLQQTAPPHFSNKLPWSRQYQSETGRWPIDDLRLAVCEIHVVLAEMETVLAAHGSDEERRAAALTSLEHLQQAEHTAGASQAILARRAACLTDLGRTEEARAARDAALAIEPKSTLDFYLLAEHLRKRGDYNNALKYYLRAQQQAPDHYWVQHFMALCYRNLKQTAAAASTFSACITRRPNYAWPYVLRGICYADLGQTENADRDFEQAISIDPELFSVYLSRAVVRLTDGRFDDALSDLEQARKLQPESGKPLVNIAITYFAVSEELRRAPLDDGDPAAGVKREVRIQQLLEDALNVLADAALAGKTPNHPGLHQLRGRILERQGNIEGAIAAYRRHLELEPLPERRAFTFRRLGNVYSTTGKFDEALAAFQQSLQLEPDDGETIAALAETHLQLRHNDEAAGEYQRFLKLAGVEIAKQIPSPHLVYNGLATALEGARQKEQAIEYYTLSLMFERGQTAPLTRRGWAYLLQGRALAIRDFQEAKKYNPDNPDTLIGLAYAYSLNGDWRASLQELQPATALARDQATMVGPVGYANIFNAATVYAQCVVAVARDAALTDPQRQEQLQILFTASLGALREAHAVASGDAGHLQQMQAALKADPALNPLRSLPAFQQLEKELTTAP